MPKLSFSVDHTLGKDEAKGRVERLMPRVKAMFKDKIKDLEESWDENKLSYSFKTMGMKIKGQMEAKDDQVDMNMDLPFAAMMVKGQIEQSIRGELEKLLA